MKINKCVKESFAVIGKEGSTSDGENFVQELWNDANLHFGEVRHLAEKGENGNIVGIWGAMSVFFVLLNCGEILTRDFILREWNTLMMRRLSVAGQSG